MSDPKVVEEARLGRGWRMSLAAVAIAAFVLGGYLLWKPLAQRKTTTAPNGSVTTEVDQGRPETVILGCFGVGLVLGLTAASAGGIGLSMAGVSVSVRGLV